jgi:putative ABC transport system permease protein
MFEIDKWKEIFHVLGRNKIRTALTAFGVFWGIFMLVIMQGTGNGFETGVHEMFGGFATNSCFIWTQKTDKAYKGFKMGRSFTLENSDVDVLKKNIPEIDVIAPRAQLGGYMGGNNVMHGLKSGAFSVNGDYPEFRKIVNIDMVKGRFINQLDIRDSRKIAVIGNRVHEVLYEQNENPIGSYIQINGVNFMVVGLFDTKRSGKMGEQDAQTVYIPFSSFQKAFNFQNKLGWLAVTAPENISVTVAEEKIIALLKKRHQISPDDENAFGHFNASEEFDKVNSLFSGIKALSWIVGVVTLLAGAIGVSNIMLVTVKERTNEIGIRRAIGAQPMHIISQIILESVFLTTLAGYTGLIFGIGLLELIAFGMNYLHIENTFFANPFINIETGLSSLAILIFSGILAGLIPAYRAISIKAVDALRSE